MFTLTEKECGVMFDMYLNNPNTTIQEYFEKIEFIRNNNNFRR